MLVSLSTSCKNGNTSNISSSSSNKQSDNTKTAKYHKISAEQAKEMMSDTDEYILLDVRTDKEFKEKRIDRAILIPDYEIESRAADELPNKDSLILIYCRSGRRSEIAAKKLVKMGYTNVYDFGGIIDWPYDTVGG